MNRSQRSHPSWTASRRSIRRVELFLTVTKVLRDTRRRATEWSTNRCSVVSYSGVGETEAGLAVLGSREVTTVSRVELLVLVGGTWVRVAVATIAIATIAVATIAVATPM